ncbi:MAG: hypothetical protein AB1467_06735 [Candidatus Diapherotrites archaeon]
MIERRDIIRLYTNYKSYEENISITTTKNIEIDLGRKGRGIILRTDATITVKFNGTGNDAITVTTTDSPYIMNASDYFGIQSIILTPSTSANIKLLVW